MEEKKKKQYFCARVMADTNLYVVELGPHQFKYGEEVVIKTEFGEDLAFISSFPFEKTEIKDTFRSGRMLRYADEKDKVQAAANLAHSRDIRRKIHEISKDLKLEMNITHVLLPLSGKNIVIYYTAKGRVDFRELLKRLRVEFKEKAIMRQIGSKDRLDSFALDSRIPLNNYRASS